MKHTTALKVLTEIIRAALILLFCYTAVNKWLSYDDFLYQLRRSPFLPVGYRFLSFALPLTEIIICVLLLFTRMVRIGFLLSALLLVLFTIYITAMLLFANHVPCACGGFISSLSWQQHIILNSSLALLAMVGYRLQKTTGQQTYHIRLPKSLLQ